MRTLAWLAALALQAAMLSASVQTEAAAPQPTSEVERAFVLGRWTDTDDCTDTVEFRRDGTFVTSAGAQGLWAIIDGRIIFQGERVIAAWIEALDAETVELTQDDGSRGRSTRCTAEERWTPIAPTREFLVGSWTDNDDCEETVEFLADGTFATRMSEGRWRLEGDRLTFIGDDTVVARVQAADEDTILLIHDDESLGRSTRCAGAGRSHRPFITARTVPRSRLSSRA